MTTIVRLLIHIIRCLIMLISFDATETSLKLYHIDDDHLQQFMAHYYP